MRRQIVSSALVLADDAAGHGVAQAARAGDALREHPAGGNAGPAGDDLGHRVAVDRHRHQAVGLLQHLQLEAQAAQLVAQTGSLALVGHQEALLERTDGADGVALLVPGAGQPAATLLGMRAGIAELLEPLRVIGAEPDFHLQRSDLLLELDAAAGQLLQRRRRMGLGHSDPRCRRVEHAHRLVGQLPAADVALRQAHRLGDALLENPHAVMRLEPCRDTAQHRDRLGRRRFGHLDRLEAARQRRILLDMALVLGPGGGGDGAQRSRAPGQA